MANTSMQAVESVRALIERRKKNRGAPDPTGAPAGRPELRDPMTLAISYMEDPSEFRACNKFTLGVWNEAIYLEGVLSCAFGRFNMDWVPATMRTMPVPLHKIKFLNGTQVPVLEFWNIPQMFSLDYDSIKSANVKSITLRNLPKLNDVQALQTSTSLETVVFSDLPELTEMGDRSMYGCTVLKTVTISNLPKLSKVGDWFLFKCISLETVVFSDLPELTEVGDWSMCFCTALKTVTISNLPKLSKVGDDFLCDCTALETVVFSNLPELTEMGGWSMKRCTALKSVTISNLPKLSKTVVFSDLPELKKVKINI